MKGSVGLSELVVVERESHHSSDQRYIRDNRLIAL